MKASRRICGHKVRGTLGPYVYTDESYYLIAGDSFVYMPRHDRDLIRAMRANGHTCVNGRDSDCSHKGLCV